MHTTNQAIFRPHMSRATLVSLNFFLDFSAHQLMCRPKRQ